MSFIKSYPVVSVLTLLLLSQSAFSAQECMFQDRYTIDLVFDTAPQVYDISGWDVPSAEEGLKMVVQDVRVFPTQTILSECNAGQDGQILQARDIAEVDFTNYYLDDRGNKYLMYPTTRRGLYYGVKIKNEVSSPSICATATGYLPPNQSYIELEDINDDYEKECFDNNTPWGFYVSYFIDSKFLHIPSAEDEQEGWDISGKFTSKVLIDHGNFRLSGADGDVDDRAVLINYVAIEGKLME